MTLMLRTGRVQGEGQEYCCPNCGALAWEAYDYAPPECPCPYEAIPNEAME